MEAVALDAEEAVEVEVSAGRVLKLDSTNTGIDGLICPSEFLPFSEATTSDIVGLAPADA